MATQRNDSLDGLKEQVRPYLGQFLQEHGIQTDGPHIRCIAGTHVDDHPSMHMFAERTRLFCFACRASYDIFDAAHVLDGYPNEGRGFVHDNLFRLARRFNIPVPDSLNTLSEEELAEHRLRRAYELAARLVSTSTLGETAAAFVQERRWSEKTRARLGVGSVPDFKAYQDNLVGGYGLDADYLKSIDLLNRNLFGPDRLTFSVRDETGAVVGFAARNLTYDGNGAKYINTSSANPQYQKGRRLFGLSHALRHAPPLYVFEGYGDVVTAVENGLKNCCAIGGIFFTEQHLDTLFEQHITHLIFCLDADEAGNSATARFVELVDKVLGDRPNVRIEILVMPEGADDPDSYIRAHDVEAFRSLELTDIFKWRLEKALQDDGRDPHQVAAGMVPLVVNEASPIERDRKIQTLAKVTGVGREFLQAEVLTRLDNSRIQTDEARSNLANKIAQRLRQNPHRLGSLLADAQRELETVERSSGLYDASAFAREVDSIRQSAKEAKQCMGLATGWPMFDKILYGVPEKEAMVAVPGKPHHGKTSLFADLSARLVEHNDNAIVLVHTMDDAQSDFLYKLVAAKAGVPIKTFRYEGAFTDLPDATRASMNDAYRWVKERAQEGRLVIAGSGQVPSTIAAAANWIRRTRRNHPGASIVYIGDNYHLFTDTGEGFNGDETSRQRRNSSEIKSITNGSCCTIIASMELGKKDLAPGMRPRKDSIRGSAGMIYDATIVWNVYNQKVDVPEGQATLIWQDSNDTVAEKVGTTELYVPVIKPVVELLVDKNKRDGQLGRFYYYFDPAISRFTECNGEDWEQFKNLSEQEESENYGRRHAKAA